MPSNARILIAEDDAGIRDIIRTRLQMAGYVVETARNGVVALSKLSTWRPAAMILDINMPELDGFGVLEALGPDAGLTPILVLTARHAAEDVRRAIGLGAKDYLAKPFSESQLLARVARLLRTPRRPEPPFVLI
jgi:two-component system OmpR family response regulator